MPRMRLLFLPGSAAKSAGALSWLPARSDGRAALQCSGAAWASQSLERAPWRVGLASPVILGVGTPG
eukprot:13778557-Alexandrium_andersonii.AAC.1